MEEETIKQNIENCERKVPVKLTAAQLAKIDKNRQKALLLRQSRIAGKLLVKSKLNNNGEDGEKRIIQIDQNNTGNNKKIIDSGAGFFIDEDELETKAKRTRKVMEGECIIAGDKTVCLECAKKFLDSYLLRTFDHSVCDKCKDMDEKHKLITKTDAKSKYLLQDVDFTKREPVLKFITKRNPHNPRWGDMTLYLLSQIEKKALDIHGSFDNIEDKLNERAIKSEAKKLKKFSKKMKTLQREVRSSLYQKDNSVHEHEFAEEVCIDEENDMWKKTCTTCDYSIEFEKM